MPLMFADPTYDISFKRLFGDKENVALTKSFLNEILDRKEGCRIKEIIFTGTEKTPRFQTEKKTYIDIQCKDESGSEFIIEMQSAKEDFFAKRAQYYVAHGVARQLEKGAFYAELKPVVFVGVLDFHLFESSNVITHHLITNQDTHKQNLNLMEFHFVELPKFKKTEKELETVMDKWLYFLKKASKLDEIPKSCIKSEVIKEAFHIMERATWSKNDWEKYEEERKLQIYFATQEYAEQLRKQKFEEQEAKQAEREAKQAEREAKQAEREAKQAERDAKQAERDAKQAERDAKQAERDAKLAEREAKQVERAEAVAIKLLTKKIDIAEIVELTDLSIDQVKTLKAKIQK